MDKIKRSKCKISILKEGNNIVTDPDVMAAIVVDYFSKLLCFAGTSQELIKSSKNTIIPSHIVYADDILLFCTGKLLNILALKKVFQDYSKASGQNINLSKSFFYPGEINSMSKLQEKTLLKILSFSSKTFLPSRLLELISALLDLPTPRRFLGVLPSQDGQNEAVTELSMPFRILLVLVESL
ncbi:hypothetical protein KIW84_015198 [Lathyrus oleraceus]|uniref:Uncharacterized protein n=1 Tax=Pisum sativum TaxID=3888 RepID=A0A9D5BQ58_PEA|nr:hypothetical protein KIW84_015198 [Pisum sativum]